jgi:hypothetical protein
MVDFPLLENPGTGGHKTVERQGGAGEREALGPP